MIYSGVVTDIQAITMNEHQKISYVEFPARHLGATKTFFETVFDWSFQDYGSAYSSFKGQGLDGGFYAADLASTTEKGGALIVFFSDRLEETQAKVESAGGRIIKAIFSFPGGRRFHFVEPSGNEFAVWGKAET